MTRQTTSPRPQIARSNLSKSVYDYLWGEILAGNLAEPGKRVSDARLALQLGVSRGPVREALQRLEAEGLLDFSAGHGFRLRVFTDDDLDEIYTLRGVLEGLASRLVAGKLSEMQLRVLDSLVDRMSAQSAAGDWRAVFQADMEFHETIVAAAQHRRLHKAWAELRSQIIFIGNATARRLGREITDIGARHRILVDALRARTPTAAAEASEAHIREVHTMIRERRVKVASEVQPAKRPRIGKAGQK